jgi:hypothetical protein
MILCYYVFYFIFVRFYVIRCLDIVLWNFFIMNFSDFFYKKEKIVYNSIWLEMSIVFVSENCFVCEIKCWNFFFGVWEEKSSQKSFRDGDEISSLAPWRLLFFNILCSFLLMYTSYIIFIYIFTRYMDNFCLYVMFIIVTRLVIIF